MQPSGATGTTPSQVHISIGGDRSRGMYVAWYTPDQTKTSTVRWGYASGTWPYNVSGSSSQYLHGHGYHHVALISEIPVGKTVYYTVGDPDSKEWSQEHSFKAAPGPSSSVNVSIFGDMGYLDSKQRGKAFPHVGVQQEWSAVYTRQMLEKLSKNGEFDFVWLVGDIGYVDDAFAHRPLHFGYETIYNAYMDWMENITAKYPFMTSPGNHESECHSTLCVLDPFLGNKLRNFTAYNARWHMPSKESNGVLSMWYSFDYGPAHFVSINTETDFKEAEEYRTGDSHIPWLHSGGFAKDGEYVKWLENDLREAHEARLRGEGLPWLIVGGHRHIDGTPQECCEALFEKYKVDVYFAGHMHSYARTSVANGTTMVIAGGAGCDEMGPPKTLLLPEGVTEHVTSDRYSTGVLSLTPTHLSWKLIDSRDGSILDEFHLDKSSSANRNELFA